jgi:hypothetical protein
MRTFADLAKALHRSTIYLSGLQSRFELPTPPFRQTWNCQDICWEA